MLCIRPFDRLRMLHMIAVAGFGMIQMLYSTAFAGLEASNIKNYSICWSWNASKNYVFPFGLIRMKQSYVI